jgi:hypothetical protein
MEAQLARLNQSAETAGITTNLRGIVQMFREYIATLDAWMDALERRAHRNVLIVAFANKLARIAWAVLSSGEPYRPCTSAAISA